MRRKRAIFGAAVAALAVGAAIGGGYLIHRSPGAAPTAGTVPNSAAPDPGTAFVGDTSGTLSSIDLATGKIEDGLVASLGFLNNVQSIAISPETLNLYAVFYTQTVSLNGTPGPTSLVEVGLGQGSGVPPVTPIRLTSDPTAIAITPDGLSAYVTTVAGTVMPINLTTDTAGAPIPVGDDPVAIAITPNGKTAYVVNGVDDPGTGTVIPVDLATGEPGKPIPAGDDPVAIAITPNGKTAYVVNGVINGLGGGTLTPIALGTDTPGAPIPVGGNPVAIAITLDGKSAYVVDEGEVGGTVTPITLGTDKPGPPIRLDLQDPDAIAIASP